MLMKLVTMVVAYTLFADDLLAFPSCFSTPTHSLEQLLWQPDELEGHWLVLCSSLLSTGQPASLQELQSSCK
jgi:hypothetical protein